MHMQVVDGKVLLATHVITCNEEEIICFTQSEVDSKTANLVENNIDFTVTSLSWSDEIVEKARVNTYSTRSEAIEDFQGVKKLTEVEELTIENSQLKKRVEESENAILTLMDMQLIGGM